MKCESARLSDWKLWFYTARVNIENEPLKLDSTFYERTARGRKSLPVAFPAFYDNVRAREKESERKCKRGSERGDRQIGREKECVRACVRACEKRRNQIAINVLPFSPISRSSFDTRRRKICITVLSRSNTLKAQTSVSPLVTGELKKKKKKIRQSIKPIWSNKS